jgi:L-asparaginase/Glu-tRNA(Gln) amidotransferase subunit D
MAQSGCPGVFVAFNRKVMLGCRTSKVRSLSFDAFDSINCDNVAEISSIGMKINTHMLPKKNGIFRLQDRYCPDVAVIKLFPGIHREVLQMYAENGYRAFFIEAFGLGGERSHLLLVEHHFGHLTLNLVYLGHLPPHHGIGSNGEQPVKHAEPPEL